jgi:hypothetical protein
MDNKSDTSETAMSITDRSGGADNMNGKLFSS